MLSSWWTLAFFLLFFVFLFVLFLAWNFRYNPHSRDSVYAPVTAPLCDDEPDSQSELQQAGGLNATESKNATEDTKEAAPSANVPTSPAENTDVPTPPGENTDVSTQPDNNEATAVLDKGLEPNPTALLDFCRGVGETNLLTDALNCGECGHACVYLHGVGQCIDGECVLASCEEEWENCDGLPSNGCEAHLISDFYNCGSCGHTCPTVAHATSKCDQGQCVIDTCDASWAHCEDGSIESGCETYLATDASHCGACGTVCPQGGFCSGGQCYCPSCSDSVDGVCTPKVCEPGFQCIENTCRQVNECGYGGLCPPPRICQNSPGGYMFVCPSEMTDCGGTCVDLKTSLFHCGGCNQDCEEPNAITNCQAGECKITECKSGFADCGEGDCTVNLMTSSEHCGSCNHSCAGSYANGHAACEQGECVLTCTLGFANCDPSSETPSCSVDLMADSSHCGTCGHACDPATGFVCTHGECQCSKGLTRCEDICVDTATSLLHCGQCGLECPVNMTCNDGECEESRLSCGFGTTECNGACVSLAVDPQNCGQCNRKCDDSSQCIQGECVSPTTASAAATASVGISGPDPQA